MPSDLMTLATLRDAEPRPKVRRPGRRAETGGRFTASGAYAANALGLLSQVAVKVVYATGSSGGRANIGKQDIMFKQVTAKHKVSSGALLS